MSIEELKKFVVQWNNRFPYDRWWREKHNIPFLSEEHRKADFLSQMMEFYEDKMYKDLQQKDPIPYIPNQGEFFKEIDTKELTEEQKRAKFIEEAQYELDNLPKNI